jgi:hypothetical protein
MAVLRLGGGYDVNAIYAWIWTVRYSMLSRTYLLEPEAPRFAISDAAKTCSAIATLPIRLFTPRKAPKASGYHFVGFQERFICRSVVGGERLYDFRALSSGSTERSRNAAATAHVHLRTPTGENFRP